MSETVCTRRRTSLAAIAAAPVLAAGLGSRTAHATTSATTTLDRLIRYRTVSVDGTEIFYREAGRPDAPALVLLHGYPSSSRMFEPILPILAGQLRLIAPDYPGFGLSATPSPAQFAYTFENLARCISGFVDALHLDSFSLYLHDYGGPVGLRLASAQPARVRSLIIQNAVLHEEGLTPLWGVRRQFWRDRARYEPTIREAMYAVRSGEARHVGGRQPADVFNPDRWMDELAYLSRPGIDRIQLDLAFDYQSNVASYPRWQQYLRSHQPETLVLWGVHDPLFDERGARAILREVPHAHLRFIDAGHFATFDVPDLIADEISQFFSAQAARELTHVEQRGDA